jgi:hypothetical protein
MTVGRVSFANGALTAEGSGKSTAQTVLGGASLVKVLPWVLGAVGLIVVVVVISRMNGKPK